MNIIDVFNFIHTNWEKILLVITTVWTLIQQFKLNVLSKK